MNGVIECIDRNGNIHLAKYSIFNVLSNGINKLEFRTLLINDKVEEWFDFKITFIEGNLIKVTDMFIGKEEHRGMGIPEALILEVNRLYSQKIISSSNKRPIVRSESRNASASKVWMRLVDKKYAFYDSENDVFVLL